MFLPKKSKILDDLVKQSSIIKEAATEFQKVAKDLKKLNSVSANLERLENKGDGLVHKITDGIEEVFILPIDKEDIKLLSESLDDILDNLEEITNRLKIYKLKKRSQGLEDFSILISKTVKEVHKGILMVKDHKFSSKNYVACFKGIHSLENEGDRLHRKLLEELIGKGTLNRQKQSVISIIKWKEIFQTLEDTLDKCQVIAIAFDRLRIKYI